MKPHLNAIKYWYQIVSTSRHAKTKWLLKEVINTYIE